MFSVLTMEKKKYNKMENTLQLINTKYISLSNEEVKTNNEILKQVITTVIQRMERKSILFKGLYERLFYGGSYYDGVRVGHPEEFDLDVLLRLPKLIDASLIISNAPGHVYVQLNNFDAFNKLSVATEKYFGLNKLLDGKGYLDTGKVRSWMESVVITALNEFQTVNGDYVITLPIGTFRATYSKNGPAMTLKINGTVNTKPVKMEIDLVPSFLFDRAEWPKGGYRENPVLTKSTFFIVPKEPKEVPSAAVKSRYWRLSFQEQERELKKGYDRLKPALKLLKQLREIQGHVSIKSYHINTVFLWEIERQNDRAFWNENSLSYIFMHMLKTYTAYISEGNIPYYWNKKNNLIGGINYMTRQNICNRLKKIKQDIDLNLDDDPNVVAKYLLSETDQLSLMFQTKLQPVGELLECGWQLFQSLSGAGDNTTATPSTSIAVTNASESSDDDNLFFDDE